MTFVAPRIVNDVSYVTRIKHASHSVWQAQYLVKFKCHILWQAQYLVKLKRHYFVAGAVLGEVQVSVFAAGAVLGEICKDSRSAKRWIFQYKIFCQILGVYFAWQAQYLVRLHLLLRAL